MGDRLIQARGWIIAVLMTSTIVVGQSAPVHAQGQNQIVATHEYREGEVIVKLKGTSKSLKAQAFVGRVVSQKAMTLRGSWHGLNMHHFKVSKGEKVEDLVNQLNKDPDVEYAEPNYIVRRLNVGGEGQPMPFAQVQNTAAGEAGSVSASTTSTLTNAPIQMADAWAQMTPDLTPPVVAIIDTGVDLYHSAFVNSGALWVNSDEIASNGIDDDGNGYIDDVNGWNFAYSNNSPLDDDGHGTHVAGIVLGTTQDIFASPIQPAKIRIMTLKFLDATGAGSTSDAVNAIYYAVNNGAKVLNNSWGGGGYSASLLEAISYAYTRDTIFVAAAGNSSSNNDQSPTYPANYTVPNIMSIAATSDLDGFASFSNFGASTVGVGSPGVSILSTYPGNATYRMSGTSMATPFVSGVAALMVREQPSMNGYQLKNILYGVSTQISSLVNKTSTQARINVYYSLMNAKSASISSSQPAFDSGTRAPSSSGGASMGGGCGLVMKTLDGGGDGSELSGPQKNLAFFGLLAILISPILLSIALRQRAGKNLRRYTRYQIDSQVRVRFGDRELVGSVSTISLGGIQLNTDAWLEKGGVVKMAIQSPDGKDSLEVEGMVVWSEEQKRYGVQFANANENVLASISRWTQSLLKA
jgi:subtilisin family serine protease